MLNKKTSFLIENVVSKLAISQILDITNYQIEILNTNEISISEQNKTIYYILEKHRYNKKIILENFKSYNNVLIIKNSENTCLGLIFFEKFISSNKNQKHVNLYFGPTFFDSLFSFILGSTFLMEKYSKKDIILNILSEIQNPYLMIHFHTIFPKDTIFPSSYDFKINDMAKDIVMNFNKNISHINKIDIEKFKSKNSYSLYKQKINQNLLTKYLLQKDIDLRQNESLIMLIIIENKEITSIKEKIWKSFIHYPYHIVQYYKNLKNYMN